MSEEIKAKIVIEADTSGADEAAAALEKLQGMAGSSGEGAGALGDQLEAMGKQASSTADMVAGLADETKGLEEANSSGEDAVSAFNDAVDKQQEVLGDAEEAHKSFQETAGDTATVFQNAAPQIEQFAKNVEATARPLSEVGDNFVALQDIIAQHEDSLHDVARAYQDYQAFTDQFNNPVVSQPASSHLGIEDIKANMAAFEEAINSPDVTDPIAHIQGYLDQVGQSWEDFTGTIGEGRMNALYDMVDQFGGTYQVLGGMNGELEQASKNTGAFTDNIQATQAAMDEFNQADPWAAFNAGAQDASSSVEEVGKASEGFFSNYIGGLGDSIFGGAVDEAGNVGGGLLGSIGEIAGGFDAFMRPLMMGQMAIQMVSQVGQAIYNSAAIAEGPGAHGIGTFTGSVDSMGYTMQQVGGSFSESFGKQFTATIDAINQAVGDNQGGLNTTGGILGGALSFASNLLMGGLGVGLMATGIGIPLGYTMTQAGMEGVANNIAQMQGQAPEFTGQQATPAMEVQAQVQQGWSNVPTQTIKNTADALNNTNLILTEASDPQFIAAQNSLSDAQQYMQYQQKQYAAAHPYNQVQEALQSQNDYSTMQEGYAATHPDTYWNDAMQAAQKGNWFGGFGANQSGGGFWANIGQIFGGGPQDLGSSLGMDSGAAVRNWLGGMGSGAANATSGFFGGIGNWFSNLFGQGQQQATPYGPVGCFPAGTPVLLADGTEKAIETLQISDCVLACQNNRQVTTTVLARLTPPPRLVYELRFSNGDMLTTTDSHPIATPQGWKALSVEHAKLENPDLPMMALEIGDFVYTIDGVRSLFSIEKKQIEQVYNITVGEPHTFYANGVLVHNKGEAMTAGGGDLEHTFVAKVTWVEQNLTHEATAVAHWAEQGLIHAATAVAHWTEQGVIHAVTAVANWAEQNLVHMATAVAQWAEQNLTHDAIAVAQWTEQNLIHPAIAMAQWAEQNLVHMATATAQWAEKNLEHLFTGVASWVGQNLFHTFVGVAQWIGQGLSQMFNAPAFAEGVSGYEGGPAVVGEAGVEIGEHNGQFAVFDQGPTFVNLPSGSSVYPMQEFSSFSSPRMLADGTGGTLSPVFLGGASGGAHTANIVVNLDSQTLISLMGASLFQSINVGLGKRSY